MSVFSEMQQVVSESKDVQYPLREQSFPEKSTPVDDFDQ